MNNLFRAVCAWGLCLAFVVPLSPGVSYAESESAVLVMAHGGEPAWNKSVKKAVKEADLPYPHKLFFGMGDNAAEQRELQDMVSDLENGGAHTIYVVPLLVSSYSEVARQWKYLLG